ncbi:class I lanthipeptide [Paenibacillus sp. P26]|nr:class I lanthipeptide [Paenibacillus sp. P26]UUZ94173.1 class I lanthipeptide [Paenibacillus sp. P25]
MEKKTVRKLVLNKETVKLLNDSQLSQAVGGQLPQRYLTITSVCVSSASACMYQCC